MTGSLRHDLPNYRGDFEYNDDSVVQMSQTAHDPSARHITTSRLELLRRQDLHVTDFVHREPDGLVPELREHDGPLVGSGAAGQTGREVDDRDYGAAQIE